MIGKKEKIYGSGRKENFLRSLFFSPLFPPDIQHFKGEDASGI